MKKFLALALILTLALALSVSVFAANIIGGNTGEDRLPAEGIETTKVSINVTA